MAALSVRTETTEYEFSHGKKPKGFGFWILTLDMSDGFGSYTTEEFSGTGTLSEVRKSAVAHVRQTVGRAKSLVIKVGP